MDFTKVEPANRDPQGVREGDRDEIIMGGGRNGARMQGMAPVACRVELEIERSAS
jgi:hypothetical protein